MTFLQVVKEGTVWRVAGAQIALSHGTAINTE